MFVAVSVPPRWTGRSGRQAISRPAQPPESWWGCYRVVNVKISCKIKQIYFFYFTILRTLYIKTYVELVLRTCHNTILLVLLTSLTSYHGVSYDLCFLLSNPGIENKTRNPFGRLKSTPAPIGRTAWADFCCKVVCRLVRGSRWDCIRLAWSPTAQQYIALASNDRIGRRQYLYW